MMRRRRRRRRRSLVQPSADWAAAGPRGVRLRGEHLRAAAARRAHEHVRRPPGRAARWPCGGPSEA
eukprot:1353638-Pyramimonas_sp.AAC.1